MKIKRVAYETAGAVALTEDDIYILQTIYQSRLRTFAIVFLFVFLIIGVRVLPFLWCHDDLQFVCGSVTGLVLFVFAPFYFVFRKKIWAYRTDIRLGFKYEVYHQILGKQYFPFTNQYFLRLDNKDYLHHEVEAHTYEHVQVGEHYPVYFAPWSKYPFTLRARITMM